MITSITNAVDGRRYPLEFTAQMDEVTELRFCGGYTATGGTVNVTGKLSFTLEGGCALCTKPIAKSFTVDIDETFNGGDDSYACDMRTLDCGPMVRDAVLFALPARLVCSDDCKGLCYVCGNDLNVRECGCDRKTEPDPGKDNPFSALKDLETEGK